MSSGWHDIERVETASNVAIKYMQDAVDDGRLPPAVAMMHDMTVAMLQLAEASANLELQPPAVLALGLSPHTSSRLQELVQNELDEENHCTILYIAALEHMAEYVPELTAVIDEYIANL